MNICMPEKMLILKFRKNDLSTDTGKQIEFSGALAKKFFGIPANEDSADYEFIYKAKDGETTDNDGTRIQVQLKRSNQRGDYKINNSKSGGEDFYDGYLKKFLLDANGLALCEQNNSNDYLVFYKVGEKKIEFSYYRSDSMFVFDKESKKTENNNDSYNLIFYGAPGTGKSHEIKNITCGESVVRTTFHPDSDYSTFVGSYKPTMRPEEAVGDNKNVKEVIAYSFVKQAFLKAYLGAWKKYSEKGNSLPQKQYLVIEEINRGNCAQVFGDIFQLLDRSDNGFSTYPIEADDDIRKEIERSFQNDYKLSPGLKINTVVDGYISSIPGSDLSQDVQNGRVLLLPPNLYIWATMNTSDQSLFPMDSAFKRRWEWKYFPIKENVNQKWYISFGEQNNRKKCEWWRFLKEINRRIGDLTRSEDKKIGFYFCKAQKGEIKQELFVGKVLFYLYNEIMRVYGKEDFFTNEDGVKAEPISFQSFYKEDGSINASKVEEFLKKMGLVQVIQSMKSYTIDNDEISANELIHKTLEKYIEQHNTESAEEIVEKWNRETGLNLVTTEGKDEADGLDGHGDPIYIKRVLESEEEISSFIQKVQEKLGIMITESTENNTRKK